MRRVKASLLALTVTLGLGGAQASEAVKLQTQNWSFEGIFGTYDRGAAQRGFQIYKEVCASCHSLALVSYRNLRSLGFSEDEVKAIAAEAKVMDGPNDNGEMFERPARASDKFVKPFPNEKAARAANNGAYPPDLSLITKARVGGANYIYSLMTGYDTPPADVKLMDGMNYNKYFPGHQIAMPQPLQANQITYADGTATTLQQHAHDISVFLNWAAEPELEARKRIGFESILFLIIFTAVLYAVKRKVWAAVH